MTPEAPYRDALSAAHARIRELENEQAIAKSPHADRLGALLRERARAVAALESPNLTRLLVWKIYVPFGVAAVVFLVDGDWVLAGLTPVIAIGIKLAMQAFVASNRRADLAQIALLDAELASLEKR